MPGAVHNPCATSVPAQTLGQVDSSRPRFYPEKEWPLCCGAADGSRLPHRWPLMRLPPVSGCSAEATKVVVVSLDAPLAPLTVEERYREVLLVVKSGKSVVGEVYTPALAALPVAAPAEAIPWAVGDRLWRAELQQRFEESVGLPPRRPPVRTL